MNVGFVLKQGMMKFQSWVLYHERNSETSAKKRKKKEKEKKAHSGEPSAKTQDTNTNLIRSKLVHEISSQS